MKTVSCFDDFREKYFETLLIYLGTGQATIADEISEKFQTAFDPSLIFEKLCCNFFQETSEKALYKGPKSAT